MTPRIHGNALDALQLELDKMACKNINDPHEVKRSEVVFAAYIASHVARLKTQNPDVVLTMDILTKNIVAECGPAVAKIFNQYLVVFFRAVELSELLPDPRLALERSSSKQTEEIIARVSKT